MRLRLIAVGQRMPRWVSEGFETYAARMRRELQLELVEVPVGGKSRSGDAGRAREAEGELLLARSEGQQRVVLDERGAAWSSARLAERLAHWMQGGRDVALLVGGPDGHAERVQAQADERWSLSPLTLPHAMVRVLVAEQLYRAWSMNHNHPYHRA